MLFFIGLIFGFDLADSIKPYNNLVVTFVTILTFSYVGVCLFILVTQQVDKKVKIWWGFILFMLNMLGVPWFLYHCKNNTLENILKKEIKNNKISSTDG